MPIARLLGNFYSCQLEAVMIARRNRSVGSRGNPRLDGAHVARYSLIGRHGGGQEKAVKTTRLNSGRSGGV